MRKERLRELLDRFYEGDTSPEEEEMILAYFNAGMVDDELVHDMEIVSSLLSMSQEHKPDKGFESRIMSGVTRADKLLRPSVRRYHFIVVFAAAAGLLLTIALWSLYRSDIRGPSDTFTSTEIAYAETVKLLYKLSIEMNRGEQALDPLKAIEMADKSLNMINESGVVFGIGFQEMERMIGYTGSEKIDNK